MFVSFKNTITIINSFFKSRFWFSLAGDGSPFLFGRILCTFGFASSLQVSPDYKVALPACTDLWEMFLVGRSYGLGFSQSWVIGLQFISFVLNPRIQQGGSDSMSWLVKCSLFFYLKRFLQWCRFWYKEC